MTQRNASAVSKSTVDADGKLVDVLAERLIDAFPPLNHFEGELALTLYRLLARGAPVARAQIAHALKVDVQIVERTLADWPGVYDNKTKQVIGFWGLAVESMAHRFEVNGKTLYAWCAWDTLFLPSLLNASAHIASRCELSGDPIRLTVKPHAIAARDPIDVTVSFLLCDVDKLRQDVVTSFCHYVHFFRSREAGQEWLAGRTGMLLLTLDEAFALGQRINARRYPDALEKFRRLHALD